MSTVRGEGGAKLREIRPPFDPIRVPRETSRPPRGRCAACGAPLEPRSGPGRPRSYCVTCSPTEPVARNAAWRARNRDAINSRRRERHPRQGPTVARCARCGHTYAARDPRHRYCSRYCARRGPVTSAAGGTPRPTARIGVHPEQAAPVFYREVPADRVPSEQRAVARTALGFARADLGLGTLRVRWFEAGRALDMDDALAGLDWFDTDSPVRGLVRTARPDEIWVRVGQPLHRLAETVLHESLHSWQTSQVGAPLGGIEHAGREEMARAYENELGEVARAIAAPYSKETQDVHPL